MITLGVDLSAQAKKTAACEITWMDGGATVTSLSIGVDDSQIAQLARRADVVAVDVPFGWPIEFVKAVSAHAGLSDSYDSEPEPIDLRWRSTDRYVFEQTGLRPLSVSTDKIAAPAIRWARFERHWSESPNNAIDRTGSGRFLEVYPAAALRAWGLPHRSYKGSKRREDLRSLSRMLEDQARYLAFGSYRAAIEANDDQFDALVCALVARAARLGHTKGPGAQLAEARMEGWIHLPEPSCLPLLAKTGQDDG